MIGTKVRLISSDKLNMKGFFLVVEFHWKGSATNKATPTVPARLDILCTFFKTENLEARVEKSIYFIKCLAKSSQFKRLP